MLSVTALANTNPASAKIKIYGVAVSQNKDCSNAKVIGYNPAGTTYDLLTNPEIVEGVIPPGSYQCVIMYMDDLLTFVPVANDGTHCVAGTTYQRVICNGSCSITTGQPDQNNILQFTGSKATSSTGSSDLAHVEKVLLFLSTGSAGAGNQAFMQPTTVGSANGITLSGALNVSTTGASGTFVVNFNGQVRDAGSDCDLGPPTFAFR